MSLLVLGALTVGCEPVDYYPDHRPPQPASDLQKSGTGPYGGTNSDYPLGTPGTQGGAPAGGGVPTPDAGPAFTTTGTGPLSTSGSYTGANTGGSAAGNRPTTPAGGVTDGGTAGGH